MFCFFKQKTAYEMRISDWSSDVCSSDLYVAHACVFAAQTLAGHLQVSNDKNNTWTRIQAADAQSRSQMKLKSISRRVYRAILAVSLVSMAAMIMTVLLVNEDLEHTMLDVEFAQERDFILANYTGEDVLVWDTPNLAVVLIHTVKPRPAVQ